MVSLKWLIKLEDIVQSHLNMCFMVFFQNKVYTYIYIYICLTPPNHTPINMQYGANFLKGTLKNRCNCCNLAGIILLSEEGNSHTRFK